MDFTEDIFKDRSKLPDFTCQICHAFPIDPVKDNCDHCSHTFCRDCLNEWMAIKDICPISKIKLNPEKIEPDEEVFKASDHLEVKCVNFQIKCPWAGTLKELREHHKVCTKRLKTFKTNLLCALGSKGGSNEYVIPWQNLKQRDLELAAIVIDFTKTIYTSQYCYSIWNSISGIQFIWRFKDPSRNEFIYGTQFGAVMAHTYPANVERREVFNIDRGDSLEKLILFTGSQFYPRIGLKTFKKPKMVYFGYNYLADNQLTINIPKDCEIVGYFGKSGWVLDALGLVLQPKESEEKVEEVDKLSAPWGFTKSGVPEEKPDKNPSIKYW